MNEYLITNGTLIPLGSSQEVIQKGALYIKDDKIEDLGKTSDLVQKYPQVTKHLDANKKVILPGLICAHHHLYSTMARGFSPPGSPASNFQEILEKLWWKLDYALSEEDVYYSAIIPMIECIRNGTTTIVDHHASPNCCDGSLDKIAEATLDSGIRASLCYEVTDRHKPGQGIIESERFLKRVSEEKSPFLASCLGIHASFTVSDETLLRCREIAEKYQVGYHIHVAEGPGDVADSLSKYKVRPVERLVNRGICGEKTLFAHCIHIDEKEMDLLLQTKTTVLHNPESNMNNAVGVAQILKMMEKGIRVGLGTDGMSSHMPAQMRVAYLLHRLENKDPRVAFLEAPKMLLENNPSIVNQQFPVKLGALEPGGPADLAIWDYCPATNLDFNSFLGHFIFAMPQATVDTTIVGGKILMQNKKLLSLDEERLCARSRELATELHRRIT